MEGQFKKRRLQNPTRNPRQAPSHDVSRHVYEILKSWVSAALQESNGRRWVRDGGR